MTATARKAEPLSDGLDLGELAALLGEEPAKLERFVDAGIVQANGDGRFAIVQSLVGYWRYWQTVVDEAEQRRRGRAFGETLSGRARRRALEAEQ